MTIRFDHYDPNEFLSTFIAFIIVLAGISILAWIVFYFIKNSDKTKPVITKRVKILAKLPGAHMVGWYLVECEDGERLKLRTFENHKVLFSVNDIGIIRYQGNTILSFQKENRPPMR